MWGEKLLVGFFKVEDLTKEEENLLEILPSNEKIHEKKKNKTSKNIIVYDKNFEKEKTDRKLEYNKMKENMKECDNIKINQKKIKKIKENK